MLTLKDLNLDIFKITSQTSQRDRLSLLALQSALKSHLSDYKYFEIGSYLGGTLLPFVQDQTCTTIYSIDKRGLFQNDERGVIYGYTHNSSQRMLDKLKAYCSEEELKKVTCVDGISRELEPDQFQKVDLCFIDGEHTNQSAWEDFQLCLKIKKTDCIFVFHDADLVYQGIERVIQYLEQQSIEFKAYHLPDVLFVIEMGDLNLFQSPIIQENVLTNGFRGYLETLNHTEPFRKFYKKLPFKILRNAWYFLRRTNIAD